MYLSFWQESGAQNIAQALLTIPEINTINFKIKILVILPNEEIEIAKQVFNLLT